MISDVVKDLELHHLLSVLGWRVSSWGSRRSFVWWKPWQAKERERERDREREKDGLGTRRERDKKREEGEEKEIERERERRSGHRLMTEEPLVIKGDGEEVDREQR